MHVKNLAQKLLDLVKKCNEVPIRFEMMVLAKIEDYLLAEKLEIMDCLELCVLGPNNLEFLLLELENEQPDFGEYSRSIMGLLQNNV